MVLPRWLRKNAFLHNISNKKLFNKNVFRIKFLHAKFQSSSSHGQLLPDMEYFEVLAAKGQELKNI